MDSSKFLPTDEEIITQYLCKKMDDSSFSAAAICEADLRRFDPRDGVFKQGERREWFFFCSRAIEQRINITTYLGFWVTTGKDTQIFKGETLVGMKRSMVYYRGRTPTITKTNWLMHEYSLESSKSSLLQKEWVICKVFLENKMDQVSGISSQELKPSSMMQTGLLVKLKYKEDTVKFVLNNPTMDGLKTQVLKRFKNLETDALKFKYSDLWGENITIICDEDLQLCLQYFKSYGRIEVAISLIDKCLPSYYF